MMIILLTADIGYGDGNDDYEADDADEQRASLLLQLRSLLFPLFFFLFLSSVSAPAHSLCLSFSVSISLSLSVCL